MTSIINPIYTDVENNRMALMPQRETEMTEWICIWLWQDHWQYELDFGSWHIPQQLLDHIIME